MHCRTQFALLIHHDYQDDHDDHKEDQDDLDEDIEDFTDDHDDLPHQYLCTFSSCGSFNSFLKCLLSLSSKSSK